MTESKTSPDVQEAGSPSPDAGDAPWFEITWRVAAADADALAALLAIAGHDSCEIREDRGGGPTAIAIYLSAADRAAADQVEKELTKALATVSVEPGTVDAVDSTVWTENWRGHFPILEVGNRLLVLPPWEDPDKNQQERIPIVINPGLAFGTGHHETTMGCLEALESCRTQGANVADIGCGSGILSIAAAKLGAKRVVAVDVDPIAVTATIENLERNAVTHCVQAHVCDDNPLAPLTSAGSDSENYDIVIANILAETLVEMHDALTSCVKPDGVLILSGIESRCLPLVDEAFIGSHWRVEQELRAGEWVTLTLSRILS